MNVNIAGLDKAEVLVALWTRSKMQGLSFLGYSGDLTLEKAIDELRDHGVEYFLAKQRTEYDHSKLLCAMLLGSMTGGDLTGEEED